MLVQHRGHILVGLASTQGDTCGRTVVDRVLRLSRFVGIHRVCAVLKRFLSRSDAHSCSLPSACWTCWFNHRRRGIACAVTLKQDGPHLAPREPRAAVSRDDPPHTQWRGTPWSSASDQPRRASSRCTAAHQAPGRASANGPRTSCTWSLTAIALTAGRRDGTAVLVVERGGCVMVKLMRAGFILAAATAGAFGLAGPSAALECPTTTGTHTHRVRLGWSRSQAPWCVLTRPDCCCCGPRTGTPRRWWQRVCA